MKFEELYEKLTEKRQWQYGDFITLKPTAEPQLSYKEDLDDEVPQEFITDEGLWAVDGYEAESGMLNINRVEDPYPGAFCSFVHEDEVLELVIAAENQRKYFK